jgi:hypothetical protein
LQGDGLISANGGAGQAHGGGGRVYLKYATLVSSHDFNGTYNITAYSGAGGGASAGGAGTVLLKRTGQSYGDLYIDAGMSGSTAPNPTALTPMGFGRIIDLAADSIVTDGVIRTQPNMLAGLVIRPNLEQDFEYTILSNTETTITVDRSGGKPALTSIAEAGSDYVGVYRFDNVTLRRGGYLTLDDQLVVSKTLRIESYSLLTHFDMDTNLNSRLDISALSVEINENAAIDVSSRGYLGGRHGNNASDAGRTLFNQEGAAKRSGGSYGGTGGYEDGAGTNPVYGSPAAPLYAGAGGSCGWYSESGGDGGGIVWINADSITVDGGIMSNGGTGSGSGAGGGAGGSIWLTAGSVSGTGWITADGGAFQTGGGGGRIAIEYGAFGGTGADFDGTRNITAFGGHVSHPGSAGTVYLRQKNAGHGDLYVDEGLDSTSPKSSELAHIGFGYIQDATADTITTNGAVRLLPSGLVGLEIQPNVARGETYPIIANTATTITVDIKGKLPLNTVAAIGNQYAGVYRFGNICFRRGGFLTVGDRLIVDDRILVDENSVLSHYDATAQYEPRLDLIAGSIEVAATGKINVNGRGYLGGNRPDNGSTSGLTFGNVLGASRRSGGSYGGLGEAYDGVPNPVYGTANHPAALGSGGSCGWYGEGGGDGGGWISIEADAVVVDGIVSANGDNGDGSQAGCGSGGSIYIVAPDVRGTGSITANGGGFQVGGGGGRVAMHYRGALSDLTLLGIAANGGSAGAPGTVVLAPDAR